MFSFPVRIKNEEKDYVWHLRDVHFNAYAATDWVSGLVLLIKFSLATRPPIVYN